MPMPLAAELTGGIACLGYYIAAAAISFFGILSMRRCVIPPRCLGRRRGS